MGAWTNLAAIGLNASGGDTHNWATRKQIGAIAGRLGKHIHAILANQMGLSVSGPTARGLRLAFLNDVLRDVESWGGSGPITTTSQLSFGAASAVIDWLETDSAAEDLAAWLMEQSLPYAEAMLE